jgi:hypothetical protein
MHHLIKVYGPSAAFFALGILGAGMYWFLTARSFWVRTGKMPWKERPGYWFFTVGTWFLGGLLAIFVGHEPGWLAPLAVGVAPASVFAQITGTREGK